MYQLEHVFFWSLYLLYFVIKITSLSTLPYLIKFKTVYGHRGGRYGESEKPAWDFKMTGHILLIYDY